MPDKQARCDRLFLSLCSSVVLCLCRSASLFMWHCNCLLAHVLNVSILLDPYALFLQSIVSFSFSLLASLALLSSCVTAAKSFFSPVVRAAERSDNMCARLRQITLFRRKDVRPLPVSSVRPARSDNARA